MNHPCQHVSICECDQNPLSNYSSEAPDVDFFRLPAWAFRPRRLGDEPDDGWDTGAPPTTCDSTVSPEASLLCGLTGGIVTPPGINPPPPPNGPGGPTGPGGDPIVYYYNRAKVCSVPCADGTFFSYTVAAGTFVDLSQDMADQRAFSYACFLAFQRRACLTSPTSRACLDTVYSDTITVSRGGAWTFAIIAGTLPPGLTFSSGPGANQASITGTPTTAGSYSFDVQATSVIGITATKTVTIDVMGISTASPLPNGTVGTAYSETLTAVGGTAPYTFSLEIGLLPAGLTLASNGTISGTPTADGTETITVGVTDSAANFCIKDFLLTINPGACPSLIDTIAHVGLTGIGYLTTAVGTGELAHPNKAYIWDQFVNECLAFDIDTDTFITNFATSGGFQPDNGGAWAAATDRLFFDLLDPGGPTFYVGIINTANNTSVGAVNASQYQYLFWKYDLALNLVFVQTYIFDGVGTNGWIHHLGGLNGAILASTQVVGHGGIVLGMTYASAADQIIVSVDTNGFANYEIRKFDRFTGAAAGSVNTGLYQPQQMEYVPATDKIYVIANLLPGTNYHLLIYDRATLTLQKDITLIAGQIYEGITYSLGANILILCSAFSVGFVDVGTETLMCSRVTAADVRKADVFGSKFYANIDFTTNVLVYQ